MSVAGKYSFLGIILCLLERTGPRQMGKKKGLNEEGNSSTARHKILKTF